MQAILAKLKSLRESRNWSQSAAASHLNIQQNTYSLLENGKTALTIEMAEKICQVYGIQLVDLISPNTVIQNIGPNHDNTRVAYIMQSEDLDNIINKSIEPLYKMIDFMKSEMELLRQENENLRKSKN